VVTAVAAGKASEVATLSAKVTVCATGGVVAYSIHATVHVPLVANAALFAFFHMMLRKLLQEVYFSNSLFYNAVPSSISYPVAGIVGHVI